MVQALSPRQRHHLARNVTARGEKVGAEQNEVDVPDTLDIAFRAWNIWLSVIVCLAKLQKSRKEEVWCRVGGCISVNLRGRRGIRRECGKVKHTLPCRWLWWFRIAALWEADIRQKTNESRWTPKVPIWRWDAVRFWNVDPRKSIGGTWIQRRTPRNVWMVETFMKTAAKVHCTFLEGWMNTAFCIINLGGKKERRSLPL